MYIATALSERSQQAQQQGGGQDNARAVRMAAAETAGGMLLVRGWASVRLEEPRWQAD